MQNQPISYTWKSRTMQTQTKSYENIAKTKIDGRINSMRTPAAVGTHTEGGTGYGHTC